MRISFTWPDHLIPMVAPLGDNRFMIDLFINSILLENDEMVSRRFTRMILDLMNDDSPLWRMEIPLPALSSHLAVDAELDSLADESKRNMVGEYLADHMGSIQTNLTFKPEGKGLLRRFPIRFLANSVPDTLIARAFSGPHLIGRAEIAIRPFVGKRTYHFPLKGEWQVIKNYDYTLGHRAYAGQEFAIDLVRVGGNGLLRQLRSSDPSDYYCFGCPVEAIFDGQVVDMEDRIPDNSAACEASLENFSARVKDYGYIAGRSGNYIIIQHDSNRYSFYAHLQQNSARVKTGDTIVQGQEIASIGNSGQCSYAHLHIQLNEGANPLGSRGLPLTFSNLKDIFGTHIPFIMHNNVVIHREEKIR